MRRRREREPRGGEREREQKEEEEERKESRLPLWDSSLKWLWEEQLWQQNKFQY